MPSTNVSMLTALTQHMVVRKNRSCFCLCQPEVFPPERESSYLGRRDQEDCTIELKVKKRAMGEKVWALLRS